MLSLTPSAELLSEVLHRWCKNKWIKHTGHGLKQWQVVCDHGAIPYPLLLLMLEVGAYNMPHHQHQHDPHFGLSETTALPSFDARDACNGLVTTAVRCGKSPQATLAIYDRLRRLDLVHHLKEHSFVALVKACAAVGDRDRGHEIHATVSALGLLEASLFLGTSLIDMYAKCGSLGKALEVFDKLQIRDVVSWNILLKAHADMGDAVSVLRLFHHMQLEGISPDSLTFACALKACAALQAIDEGKCIHAHIRTQKARWEADLIVAAALVDMYAKCGSLREARAAIDKAPVRDAALWNVVITSYVKHQQGIDAIECFEQMRVEGVQPNCTTFICILKACGILGALDKCMEIHYEVEKNGLVEREMAVANCLVNTYCKCGCISKAREVFDKLLIRDVVTWTALIAGYTERMGGEEALRSFEQMQLEGIAADALTYASCLKACGGLRATWKATEIHVKLVSDGLLEKDYMLGTSLVDMYSKCGLVGRAKEAFDRLRIKDAVVWNSLIAGYAEHGYGEEALKCVEQMQGRGLTPTDATILCGMKACSNVGALGRGHKMHAEIEKKGWLEEDVRMGSSVVDMYAKCGSLETAHAVFNRIRARDVVVWNSLISGYAEHGTCENVFWIFDRMFAEGVKPDVVTFLVTLNACNRAGTVSRSERLFEAMSRDFGICPSVEHHAGMVGLLCRIGCMDLALSAIRRMRCCPNLVLWRSVLAACRRFGDVRFGERAFRCAMQAGRAEDAAST